MIHCSLSHQYRMTNKSLAENEPTHMAVGNSTLMTEYDPHKEMFMLQERNPSDQCTL